MHFSAAVVTFTTANFAAAAPFSFPLANGFPKLNATAQAEVYKLAGGPLPSIAVPTSLQPAGIQTLQLIAANELFEVAYFTELLSNITNNVPGYDIPNQDYVVKTLTAVVNQEQIHALAANGALDYVNATTIQPCEYNFPVSDFHSAISLAQTFTDVVLSVLPLAQSQFAADGGEEPGLVPVVGSIIGQEGEQNGFYRYLQNKVASAAPFLTRGAPQFAYTALSSFFVEGSCPNIDVIGLTAFPALTVVTTPKNVNSTQLFSIDGTVSASNVSVAYISGQNPPVTVPISDVSTQAGTTYFCAPFPYSDGFSRGLTIGALVSGYLPVLNSSLEVAAATLYGPALIEID